MSHRPCRFPRAQSRGSEICQPHLKPTARVQEAVLKIPFAGEGSKKLQGPTFIKMWEAMHEMEDPPITFLPQHDGQIVHVCPGIIHMVLNRQNCIKLAWESYEMKNLGLYSQAQKIGAGRYFGKANAKDYMHIGSITVKCILILLGYKYV